MLSEDKNTQQSADTLYPVTIIDLRSTAREFLERAKGDMGRAEDLLIQAAQSDQALWRVLTEDAIERRVRDLFHEVACADRDILRKGGNPPRPDDTRAHARAVQYAQYQRGKFLDSYRLAIEGHPALGDCTKAQVLDGAKRMGMQARTMLGDEAFLLAVANRLKDDKKIVADQMKEADVQKCFDRTSAVS